MTPDKHVPELVKPRAELIKFPYTHKRVLLIQAITKQVGFLVGEIPEDGVRKCLEEIESAIDEYRRHRIKV